MRVANLESSHEYKDSNNLEEIQKLELLEKEDKQRKSYQQCQYKPFNYTNFVR